MTLKLNRSSTLFIFSVIAFTLLSPKWLIPAGAFIGPALLMVLLKDRRPLPALGLAFGVFYISGLVSNYKVIPFPPQFLFIMMIQLALISSAPYVLFILLSRKLTEAWSVLVFPAVMTVWEYLASFGGGGTWGSIAYSQADNPVLIQLASVTGIWGVSFIIYWCNAVLALLYQNTLSLSVIKRPVVIFLITAGTVALFGMIRLSPAFRYTGETVRVAAITGSNMEPLTGVYEEVFGVPLNINVQDLTQSSPELAELNKGLAAFIEAPLRYPRSLAALVSFQDSMFTVAAREARAGARLIVFSEGLMFTVKPMEDDLINRGSRFAVSHKVRVLLTIASLIPGKVEFGTKYIENKAIMINSKGEVENIFFKNKPVPVVEGSIPGDGSVPVLDTEFGRIATSICYDADFPYLIRKAGRQRADVLLLPSGDWREVAPYHADMARVRAVENGFSLVRPVSGATSVVCDYKGRVIGRRDFYDHGERVLVVNLPTNGVTTIYSLTGDWLPVLCGVAIGLFVILQMLPFVRRWLQFRQVQSVRREG